jgi:hypothetical protein
MNVHERIGTIIFVSICVFRYRRWNEIRRRPQLLYILTCYKLVVLGTPASRLHRTTERYAAIAGETPTFLKKHLLPFKV